MSETPRKVTLTAQVAGYTAGMQAAHDKTEHDERE